MADELARYAAATKPLGPESSFAVGSYTIRESFQKKKRAKSPDSKYLGCAKLNTLLERYNLSKFK